MIEIVVFGEFLHFFLHRLFDFQDCIRVIARIFGIVEGVQIGSSTARHRRSALIGRLFHGLIVFT